MKEKGVPFVEYDMRADGKEEFQNFYKAKRKDIFRGPDGVEFPILTDGVEIKQGIAATLAYIHSGKNLDGFFSVGILHKEWVDGIHVSGSNPAYATEFIEVLRMLKNLNMKLQIETDGRNSAILKQILDENLAEVLIVNALGPKELYGNILNETIDVEDIAKSISLATQFPEHKFQTTVVPVVRQQGASEEISYLTPQEIGTVAKEIEEATGSKKNSYLIKFFNPKESKDERFKSIEPLAAASTFSYRTAARAHQVMTELEKR